MTINTQKGILTFLHINDSAVLMTATGTQHQTQFIVRAHSQVVGRVWGKVSCVYKMQTHWTYHMRMFLYLYVLSEIATTQSCLGVSLISNWSETQHLAKVYVYQMTSIENIFHISLRFGQIK